MLWHRGGEGGGRCVVQEGNDVYAGVLARTSQRRGGMVCLRGRVGNSEGHRTGAGIGMARSLAYADRLRRIGYSGWAEGFSESRSGVDSEGRVNEEKTAEGEKAGKW